MKRIRRLYHFERVLREALHAGSLMLREVADPLLAEFHAWLTEQSPKVMPSSLTGKAIVYTLGQWGKLVRCLDLPELTPDNYGAENAIRPFVLGHKNWLFSGNPAGADASCAIYSPIETAEANGLKPWDYLLRLCTELPATPDSQLASLLPLA